MASKGKAEWKGDLEGGRGEFEVGDGLYKDTYSKKSRFEEGDGPNPEQLIAAAHAACYSMALSNILAGEGHEADSVKTDAAVTLKVGSDGPQISKIDLTVEAQVPGLSEDDFAEHAETAKKECPVSKALAGVPEINLDAKLTESAAA